MSNREPMPERPRVTTGSYRAIVAVNWSSAKQMIYGRDRRTRALVLSPLHFRAARDGVDRDTPGKRLGRAAHAATLEPDTFVARFVAYDGIRRGEKWQAFQSAHPTQTILTVDEHERAIALAAAVRRHPRAADLLARGEPEVVRTWVDPTSRILCKCRLDWLAAPCLFVDLKTDGRTVEEHAFDAAAERLHYFGQFAFYRRGQAAHAKAGRAAVTPRAIVVESDHPHAVAVRDVDPEALDVADEEIDQILARIVECRAAEERGDPDPWPGPYPEIGEMRRPGWAMPMFAEMDIASTTEE